MQVVSVVSGIFFKGKIETIAKGFGEHSFCSTIDEITSLQPNVIIVDLEHPQALEVLRSFGSKTIAFGPHVRTDLMAIAQEFGAKAYPRSIFFNELHKILHSHL